MALADDFFSFSPDEGGGGGDDHAASELTTAADAHTGGPASADDHDGPAVGRKSRASRIRRAGERVSEPEGHLARMVRELRALEDAIVAKLGAAERTLAQLEARRTHEDGGYASVEEFEQRMLASTAMLRSMREAAPPGSPRPRLTVTKRESDARVRQTKALTAIARGRDRLRALDGEIHEAARAARGTLHAIEGSRAYDECAYTSFEEFLERALGPSPVLASAVALVADEPLPEPEPQPAAPAPPAPEAALPSTDTSDFPAFFAEPAEAQGETGAAPAEEAPQPDAGAATADAPEALAAPASRSSRTRWLVSVILCAVATVGGAAAGVFSSPAGREAGAAEATLATHAPSATQATASAAKDQAAAKDAAKLPTARAPMAAPAARVAPEHAARPLEQGTHAEKEPPTRAASAAKPANEEGKRASH